MKIGELIKQKRNEKNWSIDNVVEELKKRGIDINKSSLSRLENGDTQKIDSGLLVALANIYNFNFFKYMGYNPKLNNIESIIETEFESIPIYSSVSAGFGCEACEEPVDFLPFPKTSGEVIGIRISGDSMEDTILDGAIVIVKKNVMVEIGEIGVFLTNEADFSEGFVKRLRHKNGVYVLESDNKKYPDIEIKTSDIIACGKVIKIMNDTQRKTKDPLYAYIDMLDSQQRDMVKAMLKGLVEKK